MMILRRGSIILTSLLLMFSQHILSQQKLAELSLMDRISVLKEHFSDNSNSWITNNEYLTGRFENSHFIIRCKNYKGSSGLSYKVVKLDQTKDFEIEASLEIIKGTGGLLFGMTKDFDHYRIELTDKNDLYFLNNSNTKNKIEKLLSISNSSLIQKGSPVKLNVTKFNNVYYIFLNESLVKEFKELNPGGDQIGFNVGVNSEISVEYLNVSYLEKKNTPLFAKRNLLSKDSSSNNPTPQKPVSQAQNNELTDNSAGPKISWKAPVAERTQLFDYSAWVRATVKSGLKLEKVMVYLNGISIGQCEFKPVANEEGSYSVEKMITFKPGENSVYFVATNEKLQSEKSDLRYFTNPEATPPVLSWGKPVEENSVSNIESVTIEAFIKSQSGLSSKKILVNGIPQVEENTPQNPLPDGSAARFEGQIHLREGENSIYVMATNAAGSSSSEKRIIFYNKALAEKRIALVFGNSQYGNKAPLKNPVNDANLMEGNLKSLGFEVIKKTNASKAEMERALADFCQKLPSYNVALFYYAGHGLQVDGTNYLIPIDAKLADKAACKWEAVSLTAIVTEFEKYPNNINIVVLDACRNNPFTEWVRGNEAGFRFITDVSGTIIGYATAEGATAADGTGDNGLYTEELVKQMNIPQPIESVFKKTRVQVELRSNRTQSPRESSGLRGEFYFKRQ
jgi:hypothetical protein